MILIVKIATVVFVMSLQFSYMYKRITGIEKSMKESTYKPTPVLSGIELIAFYVIFSSCALLLSKSGVRFDYILITAFISLFISYLIFNALIIKHIKGKAVPVAVIVMTLLFFGIGQLSKIIA